MSGPEHCIDPAAATLDGTAARMCRVADRIADDQGRSAPLAEAAAGGHSPREMAGSGATKPQSCRLSSLALAARVNRESGCPSYSRETQLLQQMSDLGKTPVATRKLAQRPITERPTAIASAHIVRNAMPDELSNVAENNIESGSHR
jgi:hypothetical protein